MNAKEIGVSDKIALPASELEIARIVWQIGEATVRQVADQLPADRDVDFYTVQTYLRRLTDKGFLKCRKDGRTNLYSAAIKPDRVVSGMVTDLVDRLFDGHTLSIVQHCIQDQGLTDEEFAQLEKILQEHKAKRRK
jgi:BlaI family transcriptional regulator, penicillinase repressor